MNFLRVFQFEGFDDFIEVFRSGSHTDSSGNTKTWTNEELDQIVANHNADDPAPAVIGHPKTDDPAFAWSESVKRVGDLLLVKFKDVIPEFAEAVKKGLYRKRSVRIIPTENGFALAHIGWLGAAAPAVKDLAPVYSEHDGDAFEFEMDLTTTSAFTRFLKRHREFLIDKFGTDEADRIVPPWEVDDMVNHESELRNDPSNNNYTEKGFSVDDKGDKDMKQFSQADLDAAKATGKEEGIEEGKTAAATEFSEKENTLQADLDKERSTRLTNEFKAEIDALVTEGKLLPAQATGMVEFMVSLASEDDAEFEFSQGEGDKAEKVKKSPVDWFREFTKSIGKQIDLSESEAGKGGDVDVGDANAIAAAAVEYQAERLSKGITVSTTDAVAHITKQQ